MLQNLPYFMYKKTQVVFCLFLISSIIILFYLINAQVYVDIDLGICR